MAGIRAIRYMPGARGRPGGLSLLILAAVAILTGVEALRRWPVFIELPGIASRTNDVELTACAIPTNVLHGTGVTTIVSSDLPAASTTTNAVTNTTAVVPSPPPPAPTTNRCFPTPTYSRACNTSG